MITGTDFYRALYAGCDGVVETRHFPPGRSGRPASIWSPPDDPSEWAQACRRFRKDRQLFWGVATRRDSSSGALENCLHLPALFVDLDFNQTPEDQARRDLATYPFPPSAVVRSGHGLHAYWLLSGPLVLPNTDDRALAYDALQRKAAALHGDPAVAEPARIFRVPRSVNLKDAAAPVDVEIEHLDPALRYHVSDVLEVLPKAPTATAATPSARATQGVIPNGQRNATLHRIGRSLHANGIRFDGLREALAVINLAQCQPPLDDREIETIARQCDRQPDRDDFTGSTPAPTLLVRRLSDVQSEALDPLWPGHLYRGKFHLWAGMGEIGKTYAACDLAARGSRGGAMPDGATVGTFRTLIVTAEDGAADTIRPRIDRLGGDPSLIYAIDAETAPGLTLGQDLDAIEQAVLDTQADVLVLDTLNSFMGGKLDSKQDTAIRTVLGPLAAMAARRRLAVIGIGHFGKAEQPHVVNRILGSVGFVNAARVVAGFTADPDAPGRSFYAVIKSNLARKPDPLAYRIDPESGRIVWEDAAGIDVQAVFSAKPSSQSGKLPQAIAWLTETLTPYGSAGMPSTDVLEKGKAAGFGRDVLFEAKKAAGIGAKKHGLTGGWRWILELSAEESGHSPYSDSSYSSKDREDRTNSRSVEVSGSSDSWTPTLRDGCGQP